MSNRTKLFPILLGCLVVLNLGICLLLLKFIKTQQQKTGELQQTLQYIKRENQQQRQQFSQELTQLHTQLQQHIPDTSLINLQWLLQQANWQLNLLYHPHLAIQLLEQAQKLSLENHWDPLSQALQTDIDTIKQLPLTSEALALNELLQLQNLILHFKPQLATHSINPTQNPQIPKYLQLFRPFVQIDKIAIEPPQLLLPSQQNFICQHMLLLIQAMQNAVVTHQENLLQQLIQQAISQWQLIHRDDAVMHHLNTLANTPIVLTQPQPFISLTVLHQLEQQNRAK